jgi:hypothetical protein
MSYLPNHQNNAFVIVKFIADTYTNAPIECGTFDNTHCLFQPDICEAAVIKEHINCFKFACKYGCTQLNEHVNICDIAASKGNLEFLKCAHEEYGFNLTQQTIVRSIPHIDCFRYCHEHGGLCTYKLCIMIARRQLPHNFSECFECFKYALHTVLKDGTDPEHLGDITAVIASIDIVYLQYAHENGCIWFENTCLNAAISGNIDCLIYAHENGCPWNGNIYNELFQQQCLVPAQINCLLYAYNNNCPTTYLNEENVRYKCENYKLGIQQTPPPTPHMVDE